MPPKSKSKANPKAKPKANPKSRSTGTSKKPAPPSSSKSQSEDPAVSTCLALAADRFSIPYENNTKPFFAFQSAPLGSTTPSAPPALIFTHGASSNLTSAASKNFFLGFAEHSPISGFNGNMNLKSREKMFRAVMDHPSVRGCRALGGRSMGARAAVLAAAATDRPEIQALVLVSYPLLDGGDAAREGILLNIDREKDVLFIIGQHDAMCDIQRLDQVRRNMKAKSWLVRVEGAMHGMNLRGAGERGTEEVGKMTGAIAARWLRERDPGKREGVLTWNETRGDADWSGWAKTKEEEESPPKSAAAGTTEPKTGRHLKHKKGEEVEDTVPTRSSKRQKRKRNG